MLKRSRYLAVKIFIKVKWFILGDYYSRLAVQARYLYRSSQLFKDRWQQIGLDYAEESFDNVGEHFFNKAKKEHILIRGRIILDSFLGKEPRPYVMIEDDIL